MWLLEEVRIMVARGGQNYGCSRRSELWLLEEVRIVIAQGSRIVVAQGEQN